ncbi:hypothetical protein RRG08_037496 [Elysia crispata]|uniref:Uncharacterized protein n=1 Tax=Elysia crispata TaxID=231223 RepID=A0AAE1AZG9_9GAST|nr:hypothetical protein RRG08_037496 [Elysia crispata]
MMHVQKACYFNNRERKTPARCRIRKCQAKADIPPLGATRRDIPNSPSFSMRLSLILHTLDTDLIFEDEISQVILDVDV